MDLEEAFAARRSVRRFDTERDVPEDVLRTVLGAALSMPHAGNTYDWRAVLLRRDRRDPERWPAVFDALLGQQYVEEASVLAVWVVQPRWWADHYGTNLAALVEQDLVERDRAGQLLDAMAEPPDPRSLLLPLVGDMMMGVGAVVLSAVAHGLGATVTGCHPGSLARALDLPRDVFVAPHGVLAIGYPADDLPPRPAKPSVESVCFDGAWGVPLA